MADDFKEEVDGFSSLCENVRHVGSTEHLLDLVRWPVGAMHLLGQQQKQLKTYPSPWLLRRLGQLLLVERGKVILEPRAANTFTLGRLAFRSLGRRCTRRRRTSNVARETSER